MYSLAAKVEAAAVELAQLGEGGGGVVAQVEELEGVVAQHFARVGEGAVARGAVEQHFAELCLELGDGLADGRLGAVQAGRGAGKAALFGDGEKRFELEQIHVCPLRGRMLGTCQIGGGWTMLVAGAACWERRCRA